MIYCELLEKIFPEEYSQLLTQESSCCEIAKEISTNEKFARNFEARLRRIKEGYWDNNKAVLCNIIKNLSGHSTWEGAYSEFVSYDYFHRLGHAYYARLNCDIKSQFTFAGEHKKTTKKMRSETNIDCYLESLGIYFEIKSLRDIIQDILSKIYQRTRRYQPPDLSSITACYAPDMCWQSVQNNCAAIQKNLIESYTTLIKQNEQPRELSSPIPGLSHRLMWKKDRSICSDTSFTPYELARVYHQNIFSYSDKLLRNHPLIFVFVLNQRSNRAITNIADIDNTFFRSFARRVFCQYANSKKRFTDFNPIYDGRHTIAYMTRNISGIIFIQDQLFTGEDPEKLNAKVNFYINPNARHHIGCQYHSLINLENEYVGECDDFSSDNY